MEPEFLSIYSRYKPFTMTSIERMYALCTRLSFMSRWMKCRRTLHRLIIHLNVFILFKIYRLVNNFMKILFKSIINDQKYLRFVFSLTIPIYSVSMIWLAVRGGVQHDYHGYMNQWNLVLTHLNPWSTDNAYGPLHNLLAYAMYFGPLVPKLIIVSILIIANALLVVEIWKTRKNINDYLIYFFCSTK